MTPEQFVYWLQGFSEISGDLPTDEQWGLIQSKLSEVMERLSEEQATFRHSSVVNKDSL